jgi:hypothetical protein
MKILINRISKKDNRYISYTQAFEKGWSFSNQGANKDGRTIIF